MSGTILSGAENNCFGNASSISVAEFYVVVSKSFGVFGLPSLGGLVKSKVQSKVEGKVKSTAKIFANS